MVGRNESDGYTWCLVSGAASGCAKIANLQIFDLDALIRGKGFGGWRNPQIRHFAFRAGEEVVLLVRQSILRAVAFAATVALPIT